MRAVAGLVARGLAAAVALAVGLVLLSAAGGSSALEAQTAPVADSTIEAFTEPGGVPDDGDDGNDVARFGAPSPAPEKRAGDRVYLEVRDLGPGNSTSTLFRFSVDPLSSAEASFPAGSSGGRTLSCADNRGNCDLDPDRDRLLVRLDVADDAEDDTRLIVGVENLFDRRSGRFVIPVIGDRLAASGLDVELADGSSATRPADGDSGNAAHEAVFRVLLQDNRSPPAGLAGERLAVTTDRGVFRSTGFGTNCPAGGATSCTLTTDADGGRIHLRGDGRPGAARLTFEAAGFTVTRDVTFYGDARYIAATPEQASIEVGGSVFVVVTVTDEAGNGIAGRTPALGAGGDAVRGPRSGAVRVTATDGVAKDAAGTANDIPACRDGTNGEGRCVVRVTAQDTIGTRNDATRGTHTLTVVGGSPIPAAGRKVAVDVTVAGPPHRVSADAPARVDPGGSADVTVTAVDDRGELAAAQSVLVRQIAGGGRLVDAGPAVTRDGRYAFTWRAPIRSDVAEFEVEIRALDGDGRAAASGRVLARTRFTIRVDEEADAELPTLTPFPGVGATFTVFGGGSLAGLRTVLVEGCSNDAVTVYAILRGGGFVAFVPHARIAAVNEPFRRVMTDARGIMPAGPLLVMNCR